MLLDVAVITRVYKYMSVSVHGARRTVTTQSVLSPEYVPLIFFRSWLCLIMCVRRASVLVLSAGVVGIQSSSDMVECAVLCHPTSILDAKLSAYG